MNGIAADDSFDVPHFNWAALQISDAVKEVRGDGSRVLAVFTEPECGYCRKYEKTLAQIDNVTIYRFLMPLDPANTQRSVAIWCSGNSNQERLDALLTMMRDRSHPIGSVSCSNPIEANMRFARKHDIYLTPTTIGRDGRVIQGYLPLANLVRWLSGRGAFEK